jgi:hypothetical protein
VRPFFEGDKVVARCKTRCILIAVAACVAVSATGCQFHRTGHGFMLRSQWSLEYGDTDGAMAQGIDKPSDKLSPDSVRPASQAQADPEILPWRSRLRNRLAARLAHQGEPDSEKKPAKDATLAATDSRRPQSPPTETPILPKSPHDEGKPTPSTEPADLQIPNTSLSLPESRRPDLVLD